MPLLTLLLPALLALAPALAQDAPAIDPVPVEQVETSPAVEEGPDAAAVPVPVELPAPAEVEAIAEDLAEGGAGIAEPRTIAVDIADDLGVLGAAAFSLSALLAFARRYGLDKLLPSTAYPAVMAALGLLAGVLTALATGEPWVPVLASGLSSGVLGVLLYDRLLEPVYRRIGLVKASDT